MSVKSPASLPSPAPTNPTKSLRYADIAVTATAKEFSGFYRGKQYHTPDFQDVLSRASTANVQKILLTGMSLYDIDTNLALASQQCSITVGVHPYHAAEPEKDDKYFDKLFNRIDELYARDQANHQKADDPSVSDQDIDPISADQHIDSSSSTHQPPTINPPRLLAAYGELGLDYSHFDHASKQCQISVFRTQLDIFTQKGYNLPLFLHCRDAFDDFCEIITPYIPKLASQITTNSSQQSTSPRESSSSTPVVPRLGVIHSFVGSASEMSHLVSLGFDISVNGFSFRDPQSLEMVKAIPLDNLHVETDAPWGMIGNDVLKKLGGSVEAVEMKKRDKFVKGVMVKERNESALIERVVAVVVGILGMKSEEIAEVCWRNSLRMFWPEEMESAEQG